MLFPNNRKNAKNIITCEEGYCFRLLILPGVLFLSNLCQMTSSIGNTMKFQKKLVLLRTVNLALNCWVKNAKINFGSTIRQNVKKCLKNVLSVSWISYVLKKLCAKNKTHNFRFCYILKLHLLPTAYKISMKRTEGDIMCIIYCLGISKQNIAA